MTEITAFKQAYEQLTDSSIEFIYDSVAQAWTLDAIHLRRYLEAAAKNMDLDESAQKQWVED
jgi:hypothetical protein